MGCSLRQRLHCKCQQTVTFDRRHNLKNWILPFRGRMRKEEFRFELALWPTIATPKSRAVEAEITIRNRHLAGISLGCAEGDVAQRKPQFRRRAQISRYNPKTSVSSGITCPALMCSYPVASKSLALWSYILAKHKVVRCSRTCLGC